jgi:hypothetical protein
MMQPVTFARDGRRYRAHVEPYSRAPGNDEPSLTWWFVSIDDGPALRTIEAYPEDVPGEELYERLAAAATKAEARGPRA